MASVSGLSARHRVHARSRACQAAWLAFHHRDAIHYTQGGGRWQGIDRRLESRKGQFPHYADCSAFVTWCLWNGLEVTYDVRDTVNGLHWRAGFTGTMLNHGKHVRRLRRGDAVIYGHGFPGHHTAIYVGGGHVISHGSEAGPLLLPVHYRPDVMAYRRYI